MWLTCGKDMKMKTILTINKMWNINDYQGLIERNIDCFRANGIHLTEESIKLLMDVRKKQNVRLFFDLPGVKTRIWTISQLKENVIEGTSVSIGKRKMKDCMFYVTGESFWNSCKVSDILHIRRVNREPVKLEIKECYDEYIIAKVNSSGIIGNGYHIYNPNEYWGNEVLSEDDKMQKENIERLQPEVIAVSFADVPDIIEEARNEFGKDKRYFAKIESPQAIDNLEKIVDIADGIIIGRDDMSAYCSKEEIDNVIKRALKICNLKQKDCIGASNYLQNVYDSGVYDSNDIYDYQLLIHEGAYGVYINETNKDSDWKKYLDALDDMSNSKYIKDSRDELVKGSREND